MSRFKDDWIEMKLSEDQLQLLSDGYVLMYGDGYSYYLTLHGAYRKKEGVVHFTNNFALLPDFIRKEYLDITSSLKNKILMPIKAW